MAHASERPPARRYFFRGFLAVAAAALATYFLEDRPGLSQFVNLNLDSWVMSGKAPPKDGIAVVWITDEDYKDEFGSKSPLEQQEVLKLVRTIGECGARVIGVDLDTAEWNPKSVADLPSVPPVIWAREAVRETGMERPVPEKVLGGDGANILSGIAEESPDSDGVIRRYRTKFETTEVKAPTFPVKIVEEYQRGSSESEPHSKKEISEEKEEEKFINFLGGSLAFPHLPSRALLRFATPQWCGDKHNPLRGKIVLLGGAFRASQDHHLTPVGDLAGVDILAHTIYSELHGTNFRESKVFGLILDLLLGMSLVWFSWSLRRPWQMYLIIGVSFLLAFAGSWLVFRLFNFFVSFVPVIAGVILHELIDLRMEFSEVVREKEHLEKELAEARRHHPHSKAH